MIVGTGTDICDIRRIENSIKKFGVRFTQKIFTEHERDYCESKSGKAAYYAKRFAAKEAVAKALAGETTGSLSWQDVEVRNDSSGRPRVFLFREAQKRLSSHMPQGYEGRIHLSLSDDPPYALAFVVIEGIKENG